MGLDTTHSSSKYDHTYKLYQLFICVDMVILPFTQSIMVSIRLR